MTADAVSMVQIATPYHCISSKCTTTSRSDSPPCHSANPESPTVNIRGRRDTSAGSRFASAS